MHQTGGTDSLHYRYYNWLWCEVFIKSRISRECIFTDFNYTLTYSVYKTESLFLNISLFVKITSMIIRTYLYRLLCAWTVYQYFNEPLCCNIKLNKSPFSTCDIHIKIQLKNYVGFLELKKKPEFLAHRG